VFHDGSREWGHLKASEKLAFFFPVEVLACAFGWAFGIIVLGYAASQSPGSAHLALWAAMLNPFGPLVVIPYWIYRTWLVLSSKRRMKSDSRT
jgi:membrane protein DedA with SNARE-associated domain